MIRFALSPEGVVTPDLSARLPGRGAWVTSDRAHLEAAVKRGHFSRAFRRNAIAPADMVERVERELTLRVLSAIGLARRAGEAVFGFDKVKETLESGAVGVLIAAADASADGASKLERLSGAAPRLVGLTSAELGEALGRDGLRHVALTRGAAADRLLREARRLDGFRPLFAP